MIRFTDSPVGVNSTGGRPAPCGVGDFRPAEVGAAGRSGAFEEGEVGRPRRLENDGPIVFRENDEKPMGLYGILMGFCWENHEKPWDFDGFFFFVISMVISMVILMGQNGTIMGKYDGSLWNFDGILIVTLNFRRNPI